MTEIEAINELSYDNTAYGGRCTEEVRRVAIHALSEIQQYRAIGTVEEFKAFRSDDFTEDLLNMGYTKGYRKAIDDCYMKSKTMMEELAYQNQGRRNGKTHRVYCIQALEFLRQVAEQLKGEKA